TIPPGTTHHAHALHVHRVRRLALALRSTTPAAAPARGASAITTSVRAAGQGPNTASTDAVSAGDVASITSAALEARLATLEAQVSAHLPPVYEGRGGA
ncbi:hypothetical protein C8J57DRAFT_1722271, partial [Mycena rebaudengoi]